MQDQKTKEHKKKNFNPRRGYEAVAGKETKKDIDKAKVMTSEEFEKKHGKPKKLPTLEEILKKQREEKKKKEKKIGSILHPGRDRGEVIAGMLKNRKRA